MPPKTKRKKIVTNSEKGSRSGEVSDSELGSKRVRAGTSSSKAAEVRSQKKKIENSRDTENISDQESGVKRRKMKMANATSSVASTASNPTPSEEESHPPQLKGFVSEREMNKYASTLGLKRLTLDDLNHCRNLKDSYTGGQVLSHCSSSYGHLSIFIHDEAAIEPSQSKHLQISIGEPLATRIPSLDSNAKVFVHKATVKNQEGDNYSQDHAKRLVVEGNEPRVWIVHKDVHDPKFFSHTSCGKKWWKRTTRRRKKLQSKWLLDKGSLEPSSVTVGASAGGSVVSDRQERSEEASDRPSSPIDQATPQSSQSSSSFPINPDFPSSAFAGAESSPSSSSSSSSGSSEAESDTEWTRRRTRATANTQPSLKQYGYKKLSELRAGDEKQNVICVVKDFTAPAPSRGRNHYSSLTLVDESNPEDGVRATLFNEPNKLPQVKRKGDIVCIHRIGAKNFNGRIYLEGSGYCSSIRFSGETRKKVKPCTGSLSFTLTPTDRERVRELRRWARKRREDSHLCTLKSVYPSSYCDLVCQVVSVTISQVPFCMVLSVWDGTPHTLRHRKIAMEKNYDEGYPEVREDARLSGDSMGYCVDVVVHSKRYMQKLRNLCPGKILYLKNVHCAVINEAENVVELRLCRSGGTDGLTAAGRPDAAAGGDKMSSRITVLSSTDLLCRKLEEQIEKAITPITTTPHGTQPLCSIAEVTKYAGTVPAKFRCRVKVLMLNAASLEDLVVVQCNRCHLCQQLIYDMEVDSDGNCSTPCPNCSSQEHHRQTRAESSHRSHGTMPRRSCQFYFTLTLTDGSGEVKAHVAHQQAVELFGGLKPNNFFQLQHLRFQLNDLLYRLTGGCSPFMPINLPSTDQSRGEVGSSKDAGGAFASCRRVLGPRPWLECCLLAVKEEASGDTQYSIFDMTLINDQST